VRGFIDHRKTGDRVVKDWRKIAAGVAPDIPAEDAEKTVPIMEALERAFEPLRAAIPQGADMWTPE
jgi:hypothetical protein